MLRFARIGYYAYEMPTRDESPEGGARQWHAVYRLMP